MSLNTFCNINENINNVGDNVNKKLEKHLSNLLTENISNINVKNKNNKRNKNMNENKKNLLNIIYQSKKGYYNHNNNNYEHNTKNIIKTKDINIKKENSFKDKNLEKDIKHNLYFYTNKIKEKQVKIIDNKKTKKNDNVNSLQIDSEYQILNERVNKLFNCFFDYYDKNNQNEN